MSKTSHFIAVCIYGILNDSFGVSAHKGHRMTCKDMDGETNMLSPQVPAGILTNIKGSVKMLVLLAEAWTRDLQGTKLKFYPPDDDIFPKYVTSRRKCEWKAL